MGDAAHTAHFAIGSRHQARARRRDRTDAAVRQHGHDADAHPAVLRRRYEALRRGRSAADPERGAQRDGMVRERRRALLPTRCEPEQFMYSLLTRSQRISHENLRLRDAAWLEGYERWFARSAGLDVADDQPPPPPMFTPYTVRERHAEEPHRRLADGACTARRRRARRLPPRAPGRARAGRRRAGVRRDDLRSRRRPHHARLPGPVERRAAARPGSASSISCTRTRDAKIGMQLGHAGRQGLDASSAGKAPTSRCADGNWPLLAARPPCLTAISQMPRAMTRADMDRVTRRLRRSRTRRAAEAGFDWLELHCAHGYLLSSFHLAADQPARRRLRRQPREPAALSARGVPRDARRLAGRTSRCRCASRRTTGSTAATPPTTRSMIARHVQGRRRRPHRLLVGPGQRASRSRSTAACTRRRSPTASATRSASPTIAVGAISRGRPCQQHHRRRPRRPVRHRAPAPGRPGLDAARSRQDRQSRTSTWPKQYLSGRDQMYRELFDAREGAAARAGGEAARMMTRRADKPAPAPLSTTRPWTWKHERQRRTPRGAAPVAAAADLHAADREAGAHGSCASGSTPRWPRFDLMAQLERHPDGLKMNELSRRMMVTGGNVTGITDQLVTEGLVERVRRRGDRRACRVRLTPRGRKPVRRDGAPNTKTGSVGPARRPVERAKSTPLHKLLGKVKQHQTTCPAQTDNA